MPNDSVDPTTLEGADLVRWHQRSPWDIEQERLAARRQQYLNFFGVDPGGGGDGNQTSDEGSSDGPIETAAVGYQPSAQTPFLGLPAAATGYAPGLLGDLRWLTNQYQSQYPFAHSLPPIGVAQAGLDEAQGSTSNAPPTDSATNDGAIFDSGLWPTGNDLTPTPISAPSQPQRRSPTPNGNQIPPTAPTAQPGPAVSLRPSDGFFSWLFGGPVPIKDSTGAITGYYDHQAANEGLNITVGYAGIAPMFQPGSWAGDLLNEMAPGAAGTISDGIDEAVARRIRPW